LLFHFAVLNWHTVLTLGLLVCRGWLSNAIVRYVILSVIPSLVSRTC